LIKKLSAWDTIAITIASRTKIATTWYFMGFLWWGVTGHGGPIQKQLPSSGFVQ
jgi:hypothetical protein